MGSYPDEFPFGIMEVVELLHLRVRRQQANSVYVDCPFCGDRRGRMNVNFVKNVWRCNHCDEHGGMLALYAKLNHTTTSDAYWEIAEALCDNTHEEHARSGNEAPQQPVSTGSPSSGARATAAGHSSSERKTVPQSDKASPAEIHQTLSLLLAQLTLRPAHREHLRSPKRGLSDEQIEALGFKSTPPPFLCRSITDRLIRQGCRVQGVPGFYRDDSGHWTMAFYKKTSGILIPAIGFDGRLQGFQIMLDVPLKHKDDPPEKPGAKYIWFSSSSKTDGTGSGSPVHLIGDPSARVVYVIEGLLKADISHCLTGRTFAAIAGANNTSPLDPLFALLAQNGTEEIIEAHDMDKYNNQMTMAGASKIYLTARKYGMNCRRLTWNPNYTPHAGLAKRTRIWCRHIFPASAVAPSAFSIFNGMCGMSSWIGTTNGLPTRGTRIWRRFRNCRKIGGVGPTRWPCGKILYFTTTSAAAQKPATAPSAGRRCPFPGTPTTTKRDAVPAAGILWCSRHWDAQAISKQISIMPI